jgi:hypothetical protein
MITNTLQARLETTKPVAVASAIVSTTGMPGTGKTAWALSSVRAGKFSKKYQPVYIPMDRDPVGAYITEMLEAGRIVQPKTKFKANLKTLGQQAGVKLWDEFNQLNIDVMKEPSLNPVIWDTSGYAWKMCRLAKLGKLEQVKPHHYELANTPFEALLLHAEEHNKILICIDRMSKEYKSNSKGVEAWTGSWSRSGYSHMGYVANVVIEHYKAGAGAEFGARVLQNKITPVTDGEEMQGEIMCTFGYWMWRTFGEPAGEGLEEWVG